MKTKLAVVFATRNEEENIARSLESVKEIADEIIVFDEGSTDRTREIAKRYGAEVFKVKHEPLFHITKQKAINKAKYDWILQLDADERITPELAREILKVIKMNDEEIKNRRFPRKKKRLFKKHQRLIEEREGGLGKKTNEVVAFFAPRVNMFLGKPLMHAGVYPDGVIRLFKRGKAWLPCKSVHELMEIDGEVAWLRGNLEHHDSPTFKRYLWRLNRYTELHAKELKVSKVKKNIFVFIQYTIIKPVFTFLKLFFRHKGFLDGARGFIWSLFSGLHFPIAYFKYLTVKRYNTNQ